MVIDEVGSDRFPRYLVYDASHLHREGDRWREKQLHYRRTALFTLPFMKIFCIGLPQMATYEISFQQRPVLHRSRKLIFVNRYFWSRSEKVFRLKLKLCSRQWSVIFKPL